MKALIKKISLYLATALLANILLMSSVTLATDWTNPDITIRNLTDCVDLSKDGEGNKIVTILEEGIPISDSANIDGNKVKTCFRHTVQFTSGKSVTTQAELSTDSCLDPPTGENASKIAYSCQRVQVFFSSGGTDLLFTYIRVIYQWGVSMGGLFAVVIIVLSGIQISASGGDSEAIESAKKRIIKSFAGIAVLFLSGLILYTINPTFFTL